MCRAGGIRPGVSMMLVREMPPAFAVHVTGHDCKDVTSLYHYIDSSRPLAAMGALPLSGFPAPPYGTVGRGAVPASLTPLLDQGYFIL